MSANICETCFKITGEERHYIGITPLPHRLNDAEYIAYGTISEPHAAYHGPLGRTVESDLSKKRNQILHHHFCDFYLFISLSDQKRLGARGSSIRKRKNLRIDIDERKNGRKRFSDGDCRFE